MTRASSTPSQADRLAGSLLGLALGDALGFVVEAAPAEVALAYAREELATRCIGARAHPDFPFGQYSDDTQLARALLLGVCDTGGWDPAAFARRVEELFRAGDVVGAGPGSRAAAARLSAGVSWRESGTPAPYAGNGGAMRVAPLGVLLADDPARLIEAAAEQCLVTHLDPRCAGGAVAVAGATALASRPGPIDGPRLLQDLAEMVSTVNLEMADVVGAVPAWLDLPPAKAREQLHQAALDPGQGPVWCGISSNVVPSVAWSLYAALHSPDDYWAAVCTAIEAGGDTDTMGAMTGGIVGARVGKRGLPETLLCRLTDRDRWAAEELERLAIDCAGVIGSGQPAPESP
ncbi:MAG TPA: ADP-ribosylglycohydrolase family protein [Gemmatimonadales bacterium]|nr:ADP-ribosylglycohydrolase family protein [Gemmatimonadales bacterium]